MSLIEWIGESISPKKVGNIANEAPAYSRKSKVFIILNFIISGLILASYYYLLFRNEPSISIKEIGFSSIIILCYLLMSYYFKPKPDYDNVGIFGGIIDHPFRISDDFNRILIVLKILLIPGRYVASSIRDFYKFVKITRN
ncbi:hypothetical protein IFO69_13125 [Echinicola sp. CAU 1574]|uniref:Uncharacterized protein n=1 Tax=Echinicola arenosa TaxID=2774144 RepID=A0ABR9AMX1_9BACT|nr:hypothetical protein [Echinicola arenosa]MBD8489692.1 hypothetical protein [Echinicola arenosa]